MSATPDDETAPFGYLLKVRSSRPAALLCLHVRERTARNRFFAYYTRHPIEPGRDWLFFFNVVSGAAVGDDRPYTAWVRLVGPAEVVSVRKVDLSEWRLGLPLSIVFDETDAHAGSPFIGAQAPASDQLAGPAAVQTLLDQPRILMGN